MGLTATASVGQVFLNWTVTPTANGYNVLRSTGGGAYTLLTRLTETTLPQYTDTSVTNGTAYSYEVEAVNQTGTSAPSAAASAIPMASGALPTGWMDADIGTVQVAGSAQFASVSNNTYLITGQGSGIGGSADSFNYAYTQVSGNFTLVARLVSENGTLSNTGLMMRETLGSGAAAVTMVLGSTGGRIGQMGSRSSIAGNMSWTTGNEYTYAPTWFKLQRAGNLFTASASQNGVNWFTVGTKTIAMATTYYVGLATCSGDTATDTTEITTFDNVAVAAAPKAALAVTAASPTVTYGQALPTYTATYGGFVNSDTASVLSGSPSLTTVPATPSDAGTYTITAGPGTLSAVNYSFVFVNGTLTIQPATLTMTANSASRIYGTANPTFTGTLSGQVNNDSFKESFSTPATTLSNVGTYPIVPGVAGTNLGDYTQTITNGTLTVIQAGTSTTLGASGTVTPSGTSATLTAQVASKTSGAPTGTVSFYSDKTLLGSSPVSGGMASYTALLAAGSTYSLTAVYNGDTNFTISSSSATVITAAPLDFTLTATGTTTQTVVPGNSVSYQFAIAPNNTYYAGTVKFTASGLPAGATVAFSPETISATDGAQPVTMTIKTAAVTAQKSEPSIGRKMAPLTLALLLLPLLGTKRMRRERRKMSRWFCLLILLGGMMATAALTGCGSDNVFFSQAPKDYIVTVAATGGSQQHSFAVTLNVQ